MAGKHYVIATQTGYLVDHVTGYPHEFASRTQAVKALADEVKAAAQECRRSHKACSVVGSARSGSVQIKVGGRQGYHLWQRYVISERPGSRKPRKGSDLFRELRAASAPVHATRRKSAVELDREIAEVIGARPISRRKRVRHFSRWDDKTGRTHYAVTYEDRSGHAITREELDRYRAAEARR